MAETELPDDSDSDLVRRVQRGESAAFDLLVRKYQHRIAGLIGRYIADWSEVQDVALAQLVQPAADLRKRQVFRLQPADQPQPRQVSIVVLGAGPGLAHGRQQPLREVVADGAGRDPGKIGELGQGMAVVLSHTDILTVLRHTVNTQPEA